MRWGVMPAAPVRRLVRRADHPLSYLDFDGHSKALMALHGLQSDASFTADGAVPGDCGFRVLAPDFRGHGGTCGPVTGDLDELVADVAHLMRVAGTSPSAVLGFSLGGSVAIRLAARHPDLVTGLVLVDTPPQCRPWLAARITAGPATFPSPVDLSAAGAQAGPVAARAARRVEDGWAWPQPIDVTVAEEAAMNQDLWSDWLASSCPALVVHGTRSDVLDFDTAEEMAARRPSTQVAHIGGTHAVYLTAAAAYSRAVGQFLEELHHRS